MALTKQYVYKELSVPKAYATITGLSAIKVVNGDKKLSLDVKIGIYPNSNKTNILEESEVKIVLSYNDATIKYSDIYDAIKKNAEWSDWKDC